MLQRVQETKPWRKQPREMFDFRCNKHGIAFKFSATIFPGWARPHKVYRCPVCVAEAKAIVMREKRRYQMTGTFGACRAVSVWYGLTKAGEKRR